MTKVSSVIKHVLHNGDETAIVIVLEKGKTVFLEENDRVYLELTKAATGDKVQFPNYVPPAPKKEPEPEPESEPVILRDSHPPVDEKPVVELVNENDLSLPEAPATPVDEIPVPEPQASPSPEPENGPGPDA